MVATVTEMAATDAIARAHTTGAELRGLVDTVLSEAGIAESVRLAYYDCFLNIEAAEPGLRALFLQEAVRAGALVRGIFYPTTAHTAEHLEQTEVAVRRAAQACGRALAGGTGADLLLYPGAAPPLSPGYPRAALWLAPPARRRASTPSGYQGIRWLA